MGLFRTAVVVGAVVALMPSDRNSQVQLYERTASAARWTLTFCDRNGELCRQGGELWGVFVKKAQFAGQMAVQIIQEQSNRSEGNGPPAEPRRQEAAVRQEEPLFERTDRGTLRQDDLRPAWRGREARQY